MVNKFICKNKMIILHFKLHPKCTLLGNKVLIGGVYSYYSYITFGAVEKVLVKGFKFLKLAIYLTYLTYDALSLSFLNIFLPPLPFLRLISFWLMILF
jgi:hypothetical protein